MPFIMLKTWVFFPTEKWLYHDLPMSANNWHSMKFMAHDFLGLLGGFAKKWTDTSETNRL